MNQGKMVYTKNVINAMNVINDCLARPKLEKVGGVLIQGYSGLGKSRFAEKLASLNGFVFMRIEATMSVKSFLVKLYESVTKLQARSFKWTNASGVLTLLLNEIHQLENKVIVLDEIDRAFGKGKLLETIRDLLDMTTATIVMVGEETASIELAKLSFRFSSRTGYLCQFNPLDLADVKKVCTEVSEIPMDNAVKSAIYSKTKGSHRLVTNVIELCEKYANQYEFAELNSENFAKVITKWESE